MVPEEGQCNALEAKPDTRTVSRLAGGRVNVKSPAEMVLVVVAGSTRGRLIVGTDRNEQLNFESLVALIGGEHTADAAEEGIIRRLCRHWKPQ